MSKRMIVVMTAVVLCAAMAQADVFGTGADEFTIDFVSISGDSGDLGSWPASVDGSYTFSGANRSDYRMGVYEVTNDQYAKFAAELGVPVTGDPLNAYDNSPYWTGADVPSNEVTWYEAAQFVNWLNTSTGHQAAYKFTGTQGTGGYALDTWTAPEADGGTDLYRHKDAFYYLPSEDEWVKAGYWNGTALQTYATKPGDALHQGDGTSGTGWNYYDDGYVTDPPGPWDVGSGSEELNGTYDMMGNVLEWMESAYSADDCGPGSYRGLRGGSCSNYANQLASSTRNGSTPNLEFSLIGFRVASEVPEPATMSLLALGGLAVLRRRKK